MYVGEYCLSVCLAYAKYIRTTEQLQMYVPVETHKSIWVPIKNCQVEKCKIVCH